MSIRFNLINQAPICFFLAAINMTPADANSGTCSSLFAVTKQKTNQIQIKEVSGDLGSSQFYLPAKVDGEAIEFYWDTGATFSVVEGNAFFIRHPVVGTLQTKGLGNVPISFDKIEIHEALIGSEILAIREFVRRKAGSSLPSTLGIDALQGKEFVFDPKEQHLAFRKFASTPASQKLSVGTKGHIILPATVSDKGYSAIWDTGAGLTTVDSRLINETPNAFTFVQKVPADDSTGTKIEMDLYLVKALTIGEVQFTDLYVLAYDFSPISAALGSPVDIALGANAIVQKKWFFSFPLKLWQAE